MSVPEAPLARFLIQACPACEGVGQRYDQHRLGHWIRTERLGLDLTAARVGAELGISRSYYLHLEEGRREWRPSRVATVLEFFRTVRTARREGKG